MEKTGESLDVIVRECDNSGAGEKGGSGGADQLRKLIEVVHPADDRIVIAIFDNDEKGQQCFEKLNRDFKDISDRPSMKKHSNGYAWALLLPEPEHRQGFSEAKNLSIEYLFSDSALEKECNDGSKLEFHLPQLNFLKNKISPESEQNIKDILCNNKNILKIKKDNKTKFANEIVPHLEQEDFAGFTPLIDEIKWILDQS